MKVAGANFAACGMNGGACPAALLPLRRAAGMRIAGALGVRCGQLCAHGARLSLLKVQGRPRTSGLRALAGSLAAGPQPAPCARGTLPWRFSAASRQHQGRKENQEALGGHTQQERAPYRVYPAGAAGPSSSCARVTAPASFSRCRSALSSAASLCATAGSCRACACMHWSCDVPMSTTSTGTWPRQESSSTLPH